MEVKIKKTHQNAIIPSKTYESDACYDCVAISEEEVAPNVWKYGLGLSFQLDRGRVWKDVKHINFFIDARPRSSIWKTGMILSNCVGTIDEHYTGEVCAVFYHVMPNMPRYKVGDRVCQIKLGSTEELNFVEVEELMDTDRGNGGYGSTGK